MTKVIAYTALHYGLDYLEYAIRSVIDHVDQHYILYSPTGSHGSLTDSPCPDNRADLYAAAVRGAGDKLVWIDGSWDYEGQQRDSIYQYAPDATTILVVDSDEVYADGLAQEAIAFAARNQDIKHIRLPFIHLWRSFYRGFAHDPAYPIRVINPLAADGVTTMPTDKRVWHFGYSQRLDLVRYKIETHGHKPEFRTDVNWFDDVYKANRQHDCHPIGSEYWNCEDIDLDHLPSVLKQHPYRRLALIE